MSGLQPSHAAASTSPSSLPAEGGIGRLRAGSNNIFILPDGHGATLIDAGPDYDGAWDDLCTQLAAHGLAVTDVHTVLLTHARLDHAGLAARWQATGARILVGRADAPLVAMDAAAREAERALARSALLRHGVPAEALDAQAGRVVRYTRWPGPLHMNPVRADGLLEDGDRVGPPDRQLRIVTCPGHTPGTLLVVDETSGAVFTGDHVLPRMAPTSGIQFEDGRRRPSLPVYMASLRRAHGLTGGAGTAYPGHGGPIVDLDEAVTWTLRLLEQRARRTLTLLAGGPATAYTLARRMFPHLRPPYLRPVMAETLGLLDLLEERGHVTADESGKHTIWSSRDAAPPSAESGRKHTLPDRHKR